MALIYGWHVYDVDVQLKDNLYRMLYSLSQNQLVEHQSNHDIHIQLNYHKLHIVEELKLDIYFNNSNSDKITILFLQSSMISVTSST